MSDRDDDFDDDDLGAELGDEVAEEAAAEGEATWSLIKRTEEGAPRHERRARPGQTVPPPADPDIRKITKAERQLRIATVAQMLVDGFKRRDVHAYINTELAVAWNSPSERSIDRFIAAATAIIESESMHNLALEKGKAKSRFDTLYKRALDAKQYGTAARIQKQINRMLGLDEPLKLRHGNDPDNPLPVNPSQNFIMLIQEVVEG